MKKMMVRTRKQKALRSAILLLLVLLLLHFTGIYYILPIQANSRENNGALGRTEVVRTLYDPEINGSYLMRAYLCENENALMLGGTQFHFLSGWRANFQSVVDLGGNAPVKAGYHSFSHDDKERIMYLYGLVDSPDVQEISIRALHISSDAQLSNAFMIPEDAFVEHDGCKYFLMKIGTVFEGLPLGEVYITALDKDGNIIEHIDSDGKPQGEYKFSYGYSTGFG